MGKAEKEWQPGADSLCSEAVSTGNLGDANIFCVNSCERGQGGSCYLLALLFSYLPEMLSGNKPADPAKVRELYELSEHFYKKAADLGVEDALFFLTDLRCFKLDDAAECLRLGDWMARGQDGQGSDGSSDPAGDPSPLPPEFRNIGARMAADIYERACSLGESRGCDLARKLREQTEDPAEGG